MDVPARCVAVYIVDKISDIFTTALQAVGAKADPGSVCEIESHGLLVISQGGSCATLVLLPPLRLLPPLSSPLLVQRAFLAWLQSRKNCPPAHYQER